MKKKKIFVHNQQCVVIFYEVASYRKEIWQSQKTEFAWWFQKKFYLVSKSKSESTVKSGIVEYFV